MSVGVEIRDIVESVQTIPQGDVNPDSSIIYIFAVTEYESRASRIRGFQELFQYGLQAPTPMFILGDNAFRDYCAAGEKFTPSLEREIIQAYDTMREADPMRGPYIGRAFFVPGIDNPNGPRTAAIWNKEDYLQEVERFYRFVLENHYDIEESNIALVLHPFINVMERKTFYGRREIQEGELPFSAGYVVPQSVPGRERQVKIITTFGSDEAVQSCPSDTLVVDPQRGVVFSKDVVLKPYAYVPLSGSTYTEKPIPPRFQQEQALTDEEAIAVAREADKVFSHRPAARIEFIMQPDGVYVREIAPYEVLSEHQLFRLFPGERVSGSVVRVETERDIDHIRGKEVIVFFPPHAFRSRTTDLFARVAALKEVDKIVALVHGTLATSHMAKILTDAGRSVILVGEIDFHEGEELTISSNNEGLPLIEYLNRYHDAIVHFRETQKHFQRVAGNKVARLAIMLNAGLPVPDGFGITSQAVWQFLRDTSVYELITSLDRIDLSNKVELEQVTALVRGKIISSLLPLALERQIQQTISDYGFTEYAIRSSGSEDGERQSRAGLYESAVAVKPEVVCQTLKRTVASYFSPASIITIRQAGQVPSQLTLGVGVHEYVKPLPGMVGAVVFTVSPLLNNLALIQIDAVEGSPEPIVSGLAKDYLRIFIDRETGKITKEQFGKPMIDISDETLSQIVVVSTQIELLFQSYQDIELLVTPQGRENRLVIIQARPL